jgi:hypothetical protein
LTFPEATHVGHGLEAQRFQAVEVPVNPLLEVALQLNILQANGEMRPGGLRAATQQTTEQDNGPANSVIHKVPFTNFARTLESGVNDADFCLEWRKTPVLSRIFCSSELTSRKIEFGKIEFGSLTESHRCTTIHLSSCKLSAISRCRAGFGHLVSGAKN